MILKVNPHKIEILDEEPVNEKEIDISKCEFEFSDEITEDYVKEAYFTLNGNTYKQIILNNECKFPSEVLETKGDVEIGVVAYKVENEEEIKRYNPSPIYINTWIGSLKEAENSEPITPTDKEQIEQMLANINIDAEKVGRITTITYVNKDGVPHYVTLEDGKSIEYDWDGTYLGIRQEGQSEYDYVNLKGDKGDAGAIKMQIVQVLPQTGSEDTIYLVPYDEITVEELPATGLPETIYVVSSTNKRYEYKGNQWVEIGSDNKYKEYVWINNDWEQIGAIGIDVDLTDYVKNTDYASSNKGGVIKTGFGLQTLEGTIAGETYTYNDYQNWRDLLVVDKGTLENVINGKGLVSNTDYATDSKGGVFKTSGDYGAAVTGVGRLCGITKTYSDYSSGNNALLVSKGTLENVITGKGLVSNTSWANDTTGGVLKVDNANNGVFLDANVHKLMPNVIDYTTYGNKGGYYFISKGTLENVLTARIGDIQTLLDNLNNGGGVQ